MKLGSISITGVESKSTALKATSLSEADQGREFRLYIELRWLNTVYARCTDSVSDAIKRALGLWYANTAVDKVIPQFHMKWIIKLSFDPK